VSDTAATAIEPGYYIATKNGKPTLVGQKLTKEEALHLCGMGVDNAFSCTADIEYVDDLLWRGWVFTKLIPETELTSAPRNARQVSEFDGWILRPNKSNPPTVTPVALVQTIPGTVISGTVSGPWGTLNRTATANTNGVAELVGKAIALSTSSLVSMTATKATVPIALADERRVP